LGTGSALKQKYNYMTLETFCSFCLSLPHVSEEFPFDRNTLVFKVGGKIFALLDVENFEAVNLKCDPEKAIELREVYNAISGGYHMNKKHWNTVKLLDDVDDKLLLELTQNSYQLVFNGLTKKIKDELKV
jgi:predicted DNA-binding protein (MmcQ/YjbR family)